MLGTLLLLVGWSPAPPGAQLCRRAEVALALAPCARGGAIRACDAGWLPEEESEEDDSIEDAKLFQKRKGKFSEKKPKDNRDKLLYKVTEITPPPTDLGQFRLGPTAACGDLISAPVRMDGEAEKVDQTFVIKRVSYRYEYQRGTYRMVGKGAMVKRTDRHATEEWLMRMLPQETAEPEAWDEPPRSSEEDGLS